MTTLQDHQDSLEQLGIKEQRIDLVQTQHPAQLQDDATATTWRNKSPIKYYILAQVY